MAHMRVEALARAIDDAAPGLLGGGTVEEKMAGFFTMQGSMRLSSFGHRIMSEVFETYSYQIPPGMTNAHRIKLGSIEFPYYMTKSHIYMFSQSDHITIELCGGLLVFLESL